MLDKKSDISDPADPASYVCDGGIEFENVAAGYGAKPVLSGLTFRVEAGQKVAIVGPTGAGKTTLVNLLMRFYECGGEILIDGVNTKDMTRENARALFSMVLQDAWVFEGTLKENVVYCKENVSEEKLREAAVAAEIWRLVEILPQGEDTLIRDSSLSGGQKQRLSIARAMVDDAPMLILDEATSNVDTRTEQLIQRAMD